MHDIEHVPSFNSQIISKSFSLSSSFDSNQKLDAFQEKMKELIDKDTELHEWFGAVVMQRRAEIMDRTAKVLHSAYMNQIELDELLVEQMTSKMGHDIFLL